VSDFRELVSALEGMTVKVRNNNVNGLFQICEEFRFRDMVLHLAQKERILALEEQMHHDKREIASLRREISRVQQLLLRFEVKLNMFAKR
jgi:hypothetical protein